ncbi:hypothetical protein FUAX_51350 (plasmid) [Fulvitalea axinellae]|uniref:DUF4369 domain-containing protein n=1 Tax=Fulvitalea axinellae TaxID=1182444 RepID=A0AAU9CRC2_9BACT|nr:hypothetical protein FUAX_51350 [Fulvitalea axinellae]
MERLKRLWTLIKAQAKRELLALGSLLVSVIVGYFGYQQAKTLERFEINNQKPILQIDYLSVDSEPVNGFRISNVGFGPAKILKFNVYYKDTLGTPYTQVLDPLEDKTGIFLFEQLNNLPEGYVVPSVGEGKSIFLMGTSSTKYPFSTNAPGGKKCEEGCSNCTPKNSVLSCMISNEIEKLGTLNLTGQNAARRLLAQTFLDKGDFEKALNTLGKIRLSTDKYAFYNSSTNTILQDYIFKIEYTSNHYPIDPTVYTLWYSPKQTPQNSRLEKRPKSWWKVF